MKLESYPVQLKKQNKFQRGKQLQRLRHTVPKVRFQIKTRVKID